MLFFETSSFSRLVAVFKISVLLFKLSGRLLTPTKHSVVVKGVVYEQKTVLLCNADEGRKTVIHSYIKTQIWLPMLYLQNHEICFQFVKSEFEKMNFRFRKTLKNGQKFFYFTLHTADRLQNYTTKMKKYSYLRI